VRGRGVGVNDSAASAAELDELDRIRKWIASPKSELRVLLTGLMFLTRIPCPSYCDHHPGFLMLAMGYFPLIGSMIGWWAAGFFDALGVFTANPWLCACGSTMATLWLTMW
jgi:adenosylcobinamide-GDP ribazoletransferase